MKEIRVFFHGSTALVVLGLLIVEISMLHTDTLYSVVLLWMRDRPVTESSTWQHSKISRDRYPSPPRNSNSQAQQSNGHYDRPNICIFIV